MKWASVIVTCLLFLVMSACSRSASAPVAGPVLYTANEGGSISFVDVGKQQTMKTVKLDGDVHNVQLSPDGKWLGATVIPEMSGHGMQDMTGDSGMDMRGEAVFLDPDTGKVLKRVKVGNHPAHIVFTGDSRLAFVTNNADQTVSVIDLQSFRVIKEIPVGKGPHGLRLSADDRYAYVANMSEDTVSVIDLAKLAEVKRITVGKSPVTTGVTADGKLLVATLNGENALAIVQLDSGKVDKVPVGSGPAQVYLDPAGPFAYVANQGTEKQPSHSVTKVDLAAHQAVAAIETGKGTHGIVVSPDGTAAFATNMFDNTVSLIDLAKNTVIGTVKVGPTPNGITLKP